MSHKEAFQDSITIAYEGTLGTDVNPRGKLVLQNAGINRVELAIFLKSNATGDYIKVFGQEITGTLASVRNGLLGSMLEGFRRDGAEKPAFRINSYPTPGIEFHANGGQVPVGNMTRVGGVVTVFVEDSDGNPIPHGFGVGQNVYDPHTEANFGPGTKVVASVPGFDNFTYSEAGADASNAVVHDFTSEFDVEVRRIGPGQMGLFCNTNLVCIIYPDAIVMQAGSLLVHSTANSITAHAGGGQGSATQLLSELNYIATAASAGDSVKLPFAGPGRMITVFNETANAVDVFPLAGEAIDALGTDVAYSLAAGASRQFFGKAALTWRSR